MIKEINHYKYEELKEPLEFDISNGTEEALRVKVNLSASESIVNYQKKMFFRTKITESILGNSLYVDFFINKNLSFEDKIKKIKLYISTNPFILVKLFELNVV